MTLIGPFCYCLVQRRISRFLGGTMLHLIWYIIVVFLVCRHNVFRNRRSSIRTRTAALSIFFGLTLITLAAAAERKIAFCRGDEVWVANVDGAGAKKICSGVWPNISPDGTQVAFNT